MPALLAQTNDADPGAREAAARALGAHDSDGDSRDPALLETLEDESPEVRGASAEALGTLGRTDDAVVGKLIERLDAKARELIEEAKSKKPKDRHETLKRIAREMKGRAPSEEAKKVLAEVEGFARTNVLTEELTEANPRAYVEVHLERGSMISGTVVDDLGEPVPELLVHIAPDLQTMLEGGIGAMANASIEPTFTEEDGSFRFEHVTAGEFRISTGDVEIDMNPFAPTTGEVVEVDRCSSGRLDARDREGGGALRHGRLR